MKKTATDSIREFNRFYTGVIGLLDRQLLHTSYSLPEARVLYELYQSPACTAKDIMVRLPMDKGYLSRILSQFKKKGLLTRKKSTLDGRAVQITLTPRGKSEFEKLNRASEQQIGSIMKKIPPQQLIELIDHMSAIKEILHPSVS